MAAADSSQTSAILDAMVEAELHVKYGSHSQAVALLESVIADHPSYLPAREALGQAYRLTGNHAKVREIEGEIALIREELTAQSGEKDRESRTVEQRRLTEKIDAIIKEIYETKELDDIKKITALRLVENLPADRCLIATLGGEEDRGGVYEYCRPGVGPSLSGTAKLNYTVFSRLSATSDLLVVDDTFTDARLTECRHAVEEFDIQALLAASIVYRSKMTGFILLQHCGNPLEWSKQGKTLFSNVAGHYAVATHNAREFTAAQAQAITDQLTGVYNRRFFEERFSVELRNAHQQSYPLSLALLDIDHFKKINDTWGHPEGDSVLHKMGFLLKTHVRKGSVVARYGGEEFAVILPNIDLKLAHKIIENIRQVVQATLATKDGAPVTFSGGIASVKRIGPNLDEVQRDLVQQADEKLYLAKKSGRNRVSSDLDQASGEESS